MEDAAKMPGNRVAQGGSIHPIEELALMDGENSPDLMLHPGLEWDWEPGFRCGERQRWFRRDGEELKHPTHFSPFPGQTISLKSD
jgi:hypothetical protein